MTPSTDQRTAARKGGEALRRAISAFYDAHPILAFAIAKVKHVQDFEFDTIGINDEELRYNPAFIAERTPEDNKFIIIHEAAHTFLGHPVRFASLKLEFEGKYGRQLNEAEWQSLHVLCNTAADLALHGLITKMPRVPTPSEWLKSFGCFAGRGNFAQLPEGKSMEHYFWALYNDEIKKQNDQAKQSKQANDSGSSAPGGAGNQKSGAKLGAGEGRGSAGGSEGGAEDSVGEGEGSGCGAGAGALGDGQPGEQGAGGLAGDADGNAGHAGGGARCSQRQSVAVKQTGLEVIAKGELVANHQQSPGEITPAKADTKEELEELERTFEDTIAQAVVTAKAQGTLPGWLQSVYETTFGPSGVNWKLVLRRFLDQVCKEGRSYAKPNRRTAWRRDIILPARLGRTAGLGMVIIDTSGSMGNAECMEGLKAISDIVRNLPGEVRVEMLQIDTTCAMRDTYTRHDLPLEAVFKGRGGTDLSPAFDEVRRRKQELRWCVCVTDGGWGYASVPDTGVPTFWLFTQAFHNQPQFGQSIRVTV